MPRAIFSANAPQLKVTINRDQASRFGISPQTIDDTLNDAYGQRQITQYFTQLNTYWIILEIRRSCRRFARLARPHLREVAADRRARCRCPRWSTVDSSRVGPLSVTHQGAVSGGRR